MARLKYKSFNGSFETALSTLSELESLAEECREIVDNASEGLKNTQRIQTFEQTADTLEGIDVNVDIPDSLTDEVVDWSEGEQTRKGRSLSRADRRDNAIAGAQAVAERCREIENEDEPELEERREDETDEGWSERESMWNAEHDEWETRKDDACTLADTLEELIGEVEGCEFPGMYG